MEKVTGIGGVFFIAKNPAELSKWYEQHLGVSRPPSTYDELPWKQQEGYTVFAPMGSDSPHFQKQARLYINFRVENLDAMCRQLQSAGIEVEVDPETYPNGRFASLEDPEGNQVQLWELL